MTPIRLLHMLRRPASVGLIALPALALATGQAKAAGESISMVQNDPTAVVGQATNFTASGTLNSDDTMFGFDVIIFEKPANLDPTCAADYATESAAAMNSGGHEVYVSPVGGFQVGTSGTFSQPFKVTFIGPGEYLLCGYVQSDFSTAASGELSGAVIAAPVTAPPTTPVTTPTPPVTTPTAPGTTKPKLGPVLRHRPWITRHRHVLTCHGGSWSHSPRLRYRWYVSGHARSIHSGRMLAVRRSLTGRHIRCAVTAHNAAGTRTASTRSIMVR